MNQFIDQCHGCKIVNDAIKKTLRNEGFCNQSTIQEFFNKKDMVIANENNPHIAYCKPCWENIQESRDNYQELY